MADRGESGILPKWNLGSHIGVSSFPSLLVWIARLPKCHVATALAGQMIPVLVSILQYEQSNLVKRPTAATSTLAVTACLLQVLGHLHLF